MSDRIVIIDPSAPATASVAPPSRRPGDLRGKTVGIIDNTKPNFDVLSEEIARLLARDYGIEGIVRQRKRAPSVPATEAMMKEMQEECDLVIAGSGD